MKNNMKNNEEAQPTVVTQESMGETQRERMG